MPSKNSRQFLNDLRSPTALGLLITIFFIYAANTFYTTRDQNDLEKSQNTNWIYEILEIANLKSTDIKFKMRGQEAVNSNVALLTVDDAAIDELGRWPWSREKMAFLIDKTFSYGAKSLALDIVFSEAQSALPDQNLAQVFQKHRDRVILGAFGSGQTGSIQPYQDYCLNAAFKRMSASSVVNPINSSFIVDDTSDEFVELKFEQVLGPIFNSLAEDETKTFAQLKPGLLGLDDPTEAGKIRARQLQLSINSRITEYCGHWLTKKDPFLTSEEVQKAYVEIFKSSKSLTGLEFETALEKFKNSIPSHPIPEHSSWTANQDIFQQSADFTASFNAEQDADGSIRQAPLFFRTGNRVGTSFIPSLAFQSYLASTGYQARLVFGIDPKNSTQKIITSFGIYDQSKDPEIFIGAIPADKQGRLKINYMGATNSFPTVSAKELFTDSPKMTIVQRKFVSTLNAWAPVEMEVDKATFFKDKIFILGATAMGVYDLRVTPFDKNFPGLEVHANVLSNLMTRNFLKTDNSESRWMPWMIALIGLLMSFIITKSGAIAGFASTVFILVGLLVADFIMFEHGWMITMVIPFLMISNLFVILTVYKYFTEERKKRHLRQTFSKYVSPAVVDEILKDPKNVQLGGRKLRMSVFFSDVRNFTSFSEKLDPRVLSDVLNQYLTPMTQIVFANKGTLDKYMGDAIMAFFGAPVFFEDHAAHACRCALQSLSRLSELQQDFHQRGLPRIDIGIGINSAEMSVGNMGSDIVRSYTVMGDAVNLGSRLESANKEYGTKILISEFTYNDVRNEFTAREIDWVRVKGKQQPIRIYNLLFEGEPPDQWRELLHHFHQGFDLYHQQKFDRALECFKKASKVIPDDECSRIYIGRCEVYLKNPPPASWDGVYEMTSK